jgi:hypothetical protein
MFLHLAQRFQGALFSLRSRPMRRCADARIERYDTGLQSGRLTTGQVYTMILTCRSRILLLGRALALVALAACCRAVADSPIVTESKQAAQSVSDTAQQVGQGAKAAGKQAAEQAKKAAKDVADAARQAGKDVAAAADKVGKDVEDAAHKTRADLKSAPKGETKAAPPVQSPAAPPTDVNRP